ncbi:MAG: penicillin-binding transpeptidase domain-containing protein, partial [Candidatus Gracilibacteria bacterium]|nr:penicillin-binding transpeptidase domain-containing protein [Candidatus Gracilibacteria bacterium]
YGYLNYGIESASKYHFDKSVVNLTKAEQIAILILPKNPSKYDPYRNISNFKIRFKKITNYLYQNKLITKDELNSILSEKLTFNENHKNKLPYVVDFLAHPLAPSLLRMGENIEKISTTIDYNLTQKIDDLAKNVISGLAWKDVGDYGIIITSRKNNDLKVMIGGIDYYEENGQVNSTTALRQVGSTIKPFTYLLSFKDLGYKPETKILDLPIQYKTFDGNSYSPKNYSLDYKGEVSLAEALSQSINIPAVKLTNEIGLNRLYNFLKKLKISSIDKKAEYYGLALTLGVSEMSLYELLQGYSIFANEGNLCNINSLKEEEQNIISPPSGTLFEKERGNSNCENIIEKEYIDMVIEILTNRYFKLKGFPINSSLDFANREVFVKTGTSRNFRDNWSVGFTENYMIGVWVGNKDGTYMKGVSGATGAGEIFRKIVEELEPINYDLNKRKIIFEENNEKKFLEIISPLNESVYKIDLTKPEEINKIKLDFTSNIDYDEIKWFKNNQQVNSDFINLKEGFFEIKVILYKNGKIVGERISRIDIEG